MKKQQDSATGFVNKINKVYKAILMGPIVFSAILYFLNRNLEQVLNTSEETALMIIPIIALSCILFGDFIFKKNIHELRKTTSLDEKLNKYSTAFTIRLALVKIPALACAFIYNTSLNLSYLIIVGALVLYMVTLAPKKEKIAEHLHLKGEEKIRFNQSA